MRSLNKKLRLFYWGLLILAVILGALSLVMREEWQNFRYVVYLSGLPFFLFISGLFGLIWPGFKAEGNSYIIHSSIIGLIFVIFFSIHTWLLLPLLFPGFRPCFGC